MLNISTEQKTLYKTDSIPLRVANLDKQYTIYFPELALTITNANINSESFTIEESLFSEASIKFGSCEVGQIKFTLADIEQDITGKEFTIKHIIDGLYEMPLGVYKVASAKKQDDLRFKDIIAYDRMRKFDVNVADWYNSLVFPTTLKAFRASLCSHIGVTEETSTLPNDNMVVTKTIEPSQISGRVVLFACEELNGAFGHMSRTGVLKHIVLGISYGMYPTETLYPADDLYPVSELDTTYNQDGVESEIVERAMYKKVKFEEYTTKEITKLQIRQEEGDVGVIVGSGTNTYAIEGNFLVYGKGSEELLTIATNAFGNIQKRAYRPYEADLIGLPYIELGDAIAFNTNDSIVSYVFNRTLSGIQALKDNYKAKGTQEIEQVFGSNKEIIQLLGKSAVIKKSIEELSATVTDLSQGTQTKFTQTDESITAEVTRATAKEGELSGSISTLAGQVILKVDSNGNIAAVRLDATGDSGTVISLQADNIALEGLVTANGNFKILLDGSIEVLNGKFGGVLTSPIINGGEINGSSFLSTSWNGNTYGTWYDEIYIDSGEIRASHTFYTADGQHTTETASILRYDSLTTKSVTATNISAVNIGTTSKYVTKMYCKEIDNDDVQWIDTHFKFSSAGYIQVYTGSSYANVMNFTTGGVITIGVAGSGKISLACSQVGFFGYTPSGKTTVDNLSAGATLVDTVARLNSLLDALQSYGLV